MDEYIEKHLNDVLMSINEVESYFDSKPKNRYSQIVRSLFYIEQKNL